MRWLIFCTVFQLILYGAFASNDITGCGGFLKSETPIDFSKVDVKLYTKQGTLKESSDCAPTNGYYFIPLSDNGEYTLSIDPPPGWFFEPKEVAIAFNGIDDPCSQTTDINFNFKGFAVAGKVSTRGNDKGPEGVTVALKAESGEEILATTTGKDGTYYLAPVSPGKYTISARHTTLLFSSSLATVVVKDGSVEVPASALVIAGFDVSGVVMSNGEPVKGVQLLLYGENGKNNGLPLECVKSEVAAASPGALCHVTSDSSGVFRFIGVPSGRYTLRPYYETFQVFPSELEIQVKLSHVNVVEKFMIKGFSVKGRVLSGKSGRALSRVSVFVNNKEEAQTNENGQFQLDSMEPGLYTLSAKSDDFQFPSLQVKISPTTPDLEPLVANGVKVCGRVVPVPGSALPKLAIRSSSGDTNFATLAKETGRFCEYLSPGAHTLSVYVPEDGDSSNFQYLPLKKEITVKDSVINGIEFSQLRANLKGRIVTLAQKISGHGLTVKITDRDSKVKSVTLNPTAESYSFSDIQPGTYSVEIESKTLCIEPAVQRITVNAPDVTVPAFKQVGYVIRIQSSHATPVDVKSTKGEKIKSINLVRGDNVVCLPNAGQFSFLPIGCHGYSQNEFKWEVGREEPFELKAVSHDLTGVITSDENFAATVIIMSNGKFIKELEPLTPSPQSGSSFRTEFTYRAAEGQQLEFIPKAPSTVFTPESIHRRISTDCLEHGVEFSGEKGIMVEGKVTPPLEGVKITLTISSINLESIIMTKTDGRFVFGPLKKNSNIELTAEKESYVIIGPDSSFNFHAHKLAQVSVKITDNATSSELSGVLLSLTGDGSYRKNSMTEEDGKKTFHSLSPGEYFLRPTMKEYKFDPSSVIIQLKAGETKAIQITGRRVAFSAFGKVTSLNGQPEDFVPLIAIGHGNCDGLQEEGLSNSDGEFRIRGLVPNCEYTLQRKPDPESSLYRVTPPKKIIKMTDGDVYGINLLAFHQIDQVDVNVHVTASNPEHLKTLTLKLSEEDNPDTPIYTIRLENVAGGMKNWGTPELQEQFLRGGLAIPLPMIPLDKKSYVLFTESTLNRKAHIYGELPVRFAADRPYVMLPTYFDAKDRPLEPDSPRHLFAALLLIVIGIIYLQMKVGSPVRLVIQRTMDAYQDQPPVADTANRKKNRTRRA